jgi:tetratricopeptide (TPR) repeat protein
MGQAAFAREQYADAIEAYEAALKADQKAIPTAKALQKLGFAHIRNGNWMEGKKRLNEVSLGYRGTEEGELASEALGSNERFQLRCNSFERRAAADIQAKLVSEKGVPAKVITISRRGRELQTVVAGSYPSYVAAKNACESLKGQGITCFVFP